MKNLLIACIRNTVLANILLLLILAAAALATCHMVRESWPEFRLDMALVTVAYPGADPEEVEEAICRKMEDALAGVEGIKEIRTTADSGLIQGLDNTSTFAFGVPNYHSGAYGSVGKFNAKIEEGPHKDQNATFVLAQSRATRQWEVIRVLVEDNGHWTPLPVKEK